MYKKLSVLAILFLFLLSAGVYAQPQANAGNQQTVNVGDTVSFSGTGSICSDCSITNYLWDFADSTSDSGVAVTHSFSSSGVMDVVLVIVSDDGKIDSDTVRITVNNQDSVKPEIIHTNVTEVESGQDLNVRATITDNVGLSTLSLYYGSNVSSNSTLTTSVSMTATGDTYTGTIPSSVIISDGLRYYIKATDTSNNVKYYPENAPTGVVLITNVSTNDTTAPGIALISVDGDTTSPYMDSTGDAKTSIVVSGENGMSCRWYTTDTNYTILSGYACTLSGLTATCDVTSSTDGAKSAYVSCVDGSTNQNGQDTTNNLDINFSLDTTPPGVISFFANSTAYQMVKLNWNTQDTTSGLKNIKVYRSLVNLTTGGTLLTTASLSTNMYVDLTILHGVKYYYYIVVEDNVGYNATSVISMAQDTSTLVVNGTRDVTAGVVLFTAGDIKNYIYKVEGLSGVTNVTVVAKNAGDFGITVTGVDTSFVGLNITPDNASFSGTSTVTFFIDKSVFDDSGATNDSVVVKHYEGTTLVGSIDADIIELDPIKGYKFNFTTISFSTFIPTYTAPVVETPDDDGDSSSSSSSGGMGSVLPPVTTETKVVNLTANVPVEIDFTVSKTLVDTLQLTTTEGFENVDIVIEKISTAPTDVSVPVMDSVYNYIQVTHDDVSNNQISRAVLTFVVDISWFEDNNETKDDVVLLRYADGVWNDLATTYISSDGTYYYFDAVSPGLSYFAIGTKIVEVVVDEPVVADDMSTQDDTTDETTVGDVSDTVIGDVSKPGMSTSTIVVIALVLISVLAFVLLRKKKPVVKTEAVSEIKTGSDTPDSGTSGSDNTVADDNTTVDDSKSDKL